MDIVKELLEYIQWQLIVTCSVEVVGIIQILKNFLPKSVPAWIYAVAMAVTSIVVTLAAVYLPSIVTVIILVACCSQLGYETIIQTFKKLASKASGDKE